MRPFFLDEGNPEHLLLAEKVLAFFNANLGKERGQVDARELYYEVGDDRLAGALAYAAERLYAYKPKPLKVRVGKSPVKLRLKLFELVGRLPPGFAIDRGEFLSALREAEGLEGVPLEELDDYLWSDDPKSRVLIGGGATAIKLIRRYNLEVLDTVLANSTLVSFFAPGSDRLPKGAFAKELVRRAKELGLIYEGRLAPGGVSIDVYGPISLFGRPTRFAWRLLTLFHAALPILREAGSWMVKARVRLRKGEVPCLIASDALPPLEARPVDLRKLRAFDSRVEEKFYRVMSGVDKYRLTREAEPLIFKDLLMVPDFVFERPDGVKWYLEIIGFWRPEYTAKKRAKLMELRRAGLRNLILLVDEKYAKHFKGLGYPAFTYRMRGSSLDAPYGKIVSLILS